MSVFIKKDDGFEEPVPTIFEKEEAFGNLIIDNPEIFPIGKFTDFAGSKWIPIAVEMEVGNGLGRLDVLGIDNEGCIYIIENKLYKNYQKKTLRQQGADYAFGLRDLKEHHNGWERFKKKIKSANKSKWAKGRKFHNQSLEETIKEFEEFDSVEDYKRCLNEVKNNFEQGDYTLVVAMDRIPPGLRISIAGHNGIDAKHEVPLFALEVNQFDTTKGKIIVASTYPYDLQDLKGKGGDKNRRGENDIESFQKYYKEKTQPGFEEDERKDFDEFRQEIEKLAEEDIWYGRSVVPQIYAKFKNIGGGEKYFVQISADGNLRFLFENFLEYTKNAGTGKPTKESDLLKEKFETNPALKEALWTYWKKSGKWGRYNKPKEWMPVHKEIIKILKEVKV